MSDAVNNVMSDYLAVYREAQKSGRLQGHGNVRAVKIAFLSDFTLRHLDIFLKVECLNAGIALDTYFSDFGQHVQESMNPESALYRFNPDIIVLSFSSANFMLRGVEGGGEPAPDASASWLFQQIRTVVTHLIEKSRAFILLNTLVAPSYATCGFLASPDRQDMRTVIREINLSLQKEFAHARRVGIFDLDAFASHFGKQRLVHQRERYLWQMEIGVQALADLSREYTRFIRATQRARAKCLVLDLDNTLWGSVLGEVGPEGIQLGPEPPGNAYLDFQRLILDYFRSGIILAINSKNNYDDALHVLRFHPHMLLREEHFACLKINWNDKAANMRAIANDLNIGLESLVFVDDNPAERLAIRTQCPEVACIEMPDDAFLFSETLSRSGLFDTLYTSEEDLKRGKTYAAERQRREAMKSFTSVEDFFFSLDMKAIITSLRETDIPRAAQMCERTNQFNLTTKRYTIGDLERMLRDNHHLLYALKLMDRFGDNGMVGLAIIRHEDRRFVIDTFLLSCRVMGRAVEDAFLAEILRYLRMQGGEWVEGFYSPTKKNAPCKDFYRNSGFTLVHEGADGSRWSLRLSDGAGRVPPWITVESRLGS